MSRSHELTGPQGEVFDIWEPETRSFVDIYKQQRPHRVKELEEMLEPYRGQEIAKAQGHLGKIFTDIRARAAADSPKPVGPEIWISRGELEINSKNPDSGQIDKKKIDVSVILAGGPSPEDAEKAVITLSGVKPYLEVHENGGEIKETITVHADPKDPKSARHKAVSRPATMHDAAFFRQVIDDYEP